MSSIASQLLKDPMGTSAKIFRRVREYIKYVRGGKYDSERYWTDRHSQYGFDKRGVGDKSLTTQANEEMYSEARSVFLELCKEFPRDLEGQKVLDIGCGVGFYSDIMAEKKVASYTGLDITDVLFEKLNTRHPSFEYRKQDITEVILHEKYQTIVMIDVTQHITDDEKLSRALVHVDQALEQGGVFVVTSWLDSNKRDAFYEKSRDLEFYTSRLLGYELIKPREFRDKYIMAFVKK